MQKTLDTVLAFIADVVQPEQVILFGSMADKRITRFSDLDLIVVVNDGENRAYYSELVTAFIKRFSLQADVLVFLKQELLTAEKYSFLAQALRAGKVVYNREE